MNSLRDRVIIERRANHRENVRRRLLAKQEAGLLSKRQQRSLNPELRYGRIDDRHRIELSPRSFNYKDYVAFEMKHLPAAQQCMSNKILAHYKFKREIFIKKSAASIASQLAETGIIEPNRKVQYDTNAKKHRNNVRFRRREQFQHAKRNTLIIIGDYKESPNSPMRGHQLEDSLFDFWVKEAQST